MLRLSSMASDDGETQAISRVSAEPPVENGGQVVQAPSGTERHWMTQGRKVETDDKCPLTEGVHQQLGQQRVPVRLSEKRPCFRGVDTRRGGENDGCF